MIRTSGSMRPRMADIGGVVADGGWRPLRVPLPGCFTLSRHSDHLRNLWFPVCEIESDRSFSLCGWRTEQSNEAAHAIRKLAFSIRPAGSGLARISPEPAVQTGPDAIASQVLQRHLRKALTVRPYADPGSCSWITCYQILVERRAMPDVVRLKVATNRCWLTPPRQRSAQGQTI